MKFEHTEVFNFEGAFRGLRNPLESWDKSDSEYIYENVRDSTGKYIIGKNDLNLAQRMLKAGSDNSKFMREIMVSTDITAPLYWWKEYDTYKVGTVANSTSFMHKGISKKFDINDFENTLNIDTLYGGNNGVEVPLEPIKEEWKDIIGYENLYKISNTGKIVRKQFTILDKDNKSRTYSEKELCYSINSSGYKKLTLRKDGVGENEYLHRLLALHFIPNPNNYSEVNHKDGNKLNCNLSNLEWVSKSQNSIHAFENNLRYITGYNKTIVGQKMRRFNEDDVLEIKTLCQKGWSQKEVADYFNCYDSTINNIVNGKNYNVPECEAIDDWKYIINRLNQLRDLYLETKEYNIWKHIVQILPESFLQTRTCTLNYQVLRAMYFARKSHKLSEWSTDFINWVNELPYAKELIEFE